MLKEDNENLSTENNNLGAFSVLNQETVKSPLKLSEKLTQPKFLAWSLVVLVVIVVIFSGTNLLNSLKTPFAVNPENVKLALNFNSNTNSENLDVASLSLLDTDKDGLSDYEEMSVYGTSRYIPDSDSDGISDGDEVKAGTDPNCPTGQTCQAVAIPTTASSTTQIANINSVTAEQAKQWLISNGLTAEELAKLDDTSILGLYQQVNSQIATASSNQAVDLQKVTPAQLRQILADQGVLSVEDLAKISDTDLTALWQETIAGQGSTVSKQ
jgi:hypothetical protein